MASSKTNRVLAACLLLAVFSGCAMERGDGSLTCVASSPVPLSEEGLVEARKRALSGSATDAFNLSSYFLRLNKLDEQKYWTQIAAENGHARAQYALAVLLSDYGSDLDKQRAKYWEKLASQCGVVAVPRANHEEAK